jgi:hypothetical protein
MATSPLIKIMLKKVIITVEIIVHGQENNIIELCFT